MQRLIRPALFLVARLGLFFSIVACITGQWYACAITFHMGTFSIGWMAGDVGHVFDFGSLPFSEWSFRVQTEDACVVSDLLNAVFLVDVSEMTVTRLPGLVLVWGFGKYDAFLYHWLIITFFALFYGVLKWTYRKRMQTPAEQPDLADTGD